MTAPPLADLGPARGQRESAGWCEAADWRVTVSAASPVTQRGRPLASRHTQIADQGAMLSETVIETR